MKKLNESIFKNLKEAENGKKVFEVCIEETVSQVFEVEAADMGEAEEIATEKYDNGEFVLEPGELSGKQMMIRDPETNEETSWFDF